MSSIGSCTGAGAGAIDDAAATLALAGENFSLVLP